MFVKPGSKNYYNQLVMEMKKTCTSLMILISKGENYTFISKHVDNFVCAIEDERLEYFMNDKDAYIFQQTGERPYPYKRLEILRDTVHEDTMRFAILFQKFKNLLSPISNEYNYNHINLLEED